MAVTGYTSNDTRSWSGSEATTITAANESYTGDITRDVSFNDFVFEGQMNATLDRTGEHLAIVFRHSSLSAFYAITYQYTTSNKIIRFKKDNINCSDSTGQIAQHSPITDPGASPHMKIQMIGSKMSMWIGPTAADTLIFDEVVDANYAAGANGFKNGVSWTVDQTISGVTWVKAGGRRIYVIS